MVSVRRAIVVPVVAATLLASPSVADDRADDTRRLLFLLAGARIAALEAYEDHGEELASLTELEEARLLLKEATGLASRLELVAPETLSALATALLSPVDGPAVPDKLGALADDVTARTGVKVETAPMAPPSVARGRELYRENCAGCHGERGAGDGPDATRRGLTPADFSNVVFMRRETPLDFFLMITVGHRRRGMPEWQALSAQQRWDLVAHVWTLQQSDGDRTEGARVWGKQCASCHGPTGTGAAGAARDLTRPGSLTERTDRTLFVGLFREVHKAPNAGLTDAQRWQVVGHARGLALGGTGATAGDVERNGAAAKSGDAGR